MGFSIADLVKAASPIKEDATLNQLANMDITAPVVQRPTFGNLDTAESIEEKIDMILKLQEANDPQVPDLLNKIHKIVSNRPDLAMVLPDETIGKIVTGIMKAKDVILAAPAKPKGRKPTTVDDL